MNFPAGGKSGLWGWQIFAIHTSRFPQKTRKCPARCGNSIDTVNRFCYNMPCGCSFGSQMRGVGGIGRHKGLMPKLSTGMGNLPSEWRLNGENPSGATPCETNADSKCVETIHRPSKVIGYEEDIVQTTTQNAAMATWSSRKIPRHFAISVQVRYAPPPQSLESSELSGLFLCSPSRKENTLFHWGWREVAFAKDMEPHGRCGSIRKNKLS